MEASSILIVDACVLIDFLATKDTVIAAIRAALGPIHVAAAVLDEVEDLTREGAAELGLIVVEPTTELLLAAAAKRGRLSLQDRICLLHAQQNGWTCVSNDGPLRRACNENGVSVLWGLETIAIATERGALASEDAIAAAEAIASVNPFITAAIVDAFRARLQSSS